MMLFVVFFFNDTATTEIYTLSLHDALPISFVNMLRHVLGVLGLHSSVVRYDEYAEGCLDGHDLVIVEIGRAHVELQSRQYLVCRLVLEKKKKQKTTTIAYTHVYRISRRITD